VLLGLVEGGPCAGGAVVRCAGSAGLVAGVSSLLGMLEGSLYTSSATDACRSSVNAVWIQRRTGGEAPLPTVGPRGTRWLPSVSGESGCV
jgi:hypothetical protein